MVQIDKGIPMPENTVNRNQRKLPWKTMEIDDSFVLGPAKPRNGGYSSNITQANKQYSPRSFARRRVIEEGVEIWRAWRTK